jgi:predicted oxidoreductase
MQIESCDVVVVGGGAAGAAAALEAHAAGSSFLLLDRLEEFGGTAITSGGGCCIAGTALQRQLGIDDSPALAISDLLTAGGESADADWARFYFANASSAVFDWLVERGVQFEFLRVQEDNSVARWHSPRGAGRGIMEPLRRALEDCSFDERWRPSTVVEDLLVESGRVVGVRAQAADGSTTEYRGRSVVMATGGFAGSVEMVRRHVPALDRLERLLVGGGRGALGDGHGLLAGHDVQVANLDSVWMYAYATPDYREPSGHRGLVVRGTEQGIWVNRSGMRFHDELLNGPGSATPALLAQDPPTCWAILDRSMLQQLRISDPYFRGNPTIPHERLDELVGASPWIVASDTVEGLAERAGIASDALPSTVAQWNSLAASGSRRDGRTGRSLKSAAPIAGPPYYAIQFLPLVRKNLGGICTDLQGRVLRTDGSVIDGLYGAGELCGFGGGHLSGAKALEGIMIPGSIFRGRVAGGWAAFNAGGRHPVHLVADPKPDGLALA